MENKNDTVITIEESNRRRWWFNHKDLIPDDPNEKALIIPHNGRNWLTSEELRKLTGEPDEQTETLSAPLSLWDKSTGERIA